MAENKKSFVLYCDLIYTFKELSDKEAGKLIKHIFSYVNDENPVMEDKLLRVAFEPIKHQLKRDLKEWEQMKIVRAESGKLGGIKSGEVRRKTKQTKQTKQMVSLLKQTEKETKMVEKNEANEANEPVNVNDTVTVNVINKAAGAIDFSLVVEYLRTATDRQYISDEQIEQEAKELINKFDRTDIRSLKGLCNKWATGIKPWQQKGMIV